MPVSFKILRAFSKEKPVTKGNDLTAVESALESERREVDALRRELSIQKELFATRNENLALREKISALEQQVASTPTYGTEEFDLLAAERQRDRMRHVQPFVPISTAGVFSYSQHQQELFALEHHKFKRGGFFLEIGVATGREYSNTYLLEKHFGWKGILCEPNPVYADAIRQNRTAILDTRAAYSVTGSVVKFLCVPGIYGLLSTISDFTASDQHNRYGEEVDVQTVSLEDLLTEHRAPREIDYISLDTEGSETLIIKDFDFRKWNIAVMTIEHNLVPGRVEQFDEILEPFGYKRVLSEVSGGDGWYVKK